MPAVLVAVASLAPAAYLVAREGFSLGRLTDELAAPSTWPLMWHTVQLVAVVAAGCAVVGVGAAVLVARTTLPLPRLWTVLFILPLGVPSFVGSYAWAALSFRLMPSSEAMYGLGGAAVVLTLTLFPYVFVPVLIALRSLDPAQEEAARSLGQRPAAAFIRVTLPQLRPAIATGSLIIGLHLLAEFGAVEMLRFPTLTTAIVQRATVLGSPEAARALSTVLAVGALGLLGAERLVRGPRRPVRTGSGSARPPGRWDLGRATPVCLLASAALVAAALGVPMYVTAAGLGDHLGGGAVFDWEPLWAAAGNTARYGALAAGLATVAALPVSVLAVRHPGRLSAVLERSTWVAHALPGVIMALALVYLSARWAYPLYQTSALLVIAYAVLYLPLAIGSQQVGLLQASGRYEEMSRSLGRGPVRTFVGVTLPLVLPAIGTGALLVALDAGKELTTTLLLRPTGEHTLTTALWATTEGEVLDFTAASPYGLALLVLGAVPAAVLARRALRS